MKTQLINWTRNSHIDTKVKHNENDNNTIQNFMKQFKIKRNFNIKKNFQQAIISVTLFSLSIHFLFKW